MVSGAFIIFMFSPCRYFKQSNRQQSIVCTVYSHSLYIAAYPRAEVFVTDTGLAAAYKWQEGKLSTDDSKKGKVVHYGLTQSVPKWY